MSESKTPGPIGRFATYKKTPQPERPKITAATVRSFHARRALAAAARQVATTPRKK